MTRIPILREALLLAPDGDADERLLARLRRALEGDCAVQLTVMLDLYEAFQSQTQEGVPHFGPDAQGERENPDR